MTKSNKFSLQLAGFIIIALVGFTLLHFFDVLSLPRRLFYILILIITMLFLVSAAIMYNSFTKSPEVFVNKFLIITTFQFLAVLSVIGAIWYKMPYHLKAFGFQFIGVFIALMIAQSVIILRNNK